MDPWARATGEVDTWGELVQELRHERPLHRVRALPSPSVAGKNPTGPLADSDSSFRARLPTTARPAVRFLSSPPPPFPFASLAHSGMWLSSAVWRSGETPWLGDTSCCLSTGAPRQPRPS